MKKYYTTFLVLLCVIGSVFSQGAFLRPLGSSFNSVHTYLKNQPITLSVQNENSLITATTDHYKIRYSFRDGLLYKVEMVRDYGDRKAFRDGIATIRSAYDDQGSFVMDLSLEKDASAFVVRKDNELHEVYQVTIGKKGLQVRQTMLDLDACSHEEFSALEQDHNIKTLLKTRP